MRTFHPVLILLALLMALLPSYAPTTSAQGPTPETPRQPNVVPPDVPAPASPLAGPARGGYTTNAMPALLSEPLDIVLVQDETSSMWDDIGALRSLAPAIWDGVAERSGAGFRMSVVGFRDYARGVWGARDDHVYRLVQDFTTDRAGFVRATDGLTALGGYDVPEGQYAALAYLLDPMAPCLDSNGDDDCADLFDTPARRQPDFRPGARRIILLATDAPFHDPSDSRGYPGPGRERVLELLRASRSTLIGLVPGGAGRLAEVDDLAAATGGSTQPTGASGQQVAEAIVAALADLRPVSPALSSVATTAVEAPADGSTPLTVTVTLRDTLGRPVAGKVVRLESERGPVDSVQQPALPTDAAGQAVGTVRSATGGQTTISAIDVTDGIWIDAGASISFQLPTIPPGEALRAAIGRIEGETQAQFDATTAIARLGADYASYYKGAVLSEGVGLATSTVLALIGAADLARTADVSRQAAQVAYPAYGAATWREITQFSSRHAEAGLFYESALSKGLFQGSWDGMSLTVLRGGLMYSTSLWARESRRDLGEEVAPMIAEMVAERAAAGDGYAKHVEGFAGDVGQLKADLAERRTRLEAGIPELTAAGQEAYARDLDARSGVAAVYNQMVRHDMDLLENLKVAREASQRDAWKWLALKLLGSAGATLAFDGTGKILFDGASTSLDLYWRSRNLDAFNQAHDTARSVVLKRAPEIATATHSNVAGAFSRLRQGLPVVTPAVSVSGIRQVSDGYPLYPHLGRPWVETRTFTTVSVANGGTTAATVEVVAQYFYKSQQFGTLWDVIPVTNYEVVTLAPGARADVVLKHSGGGEGGSPIRGRAMTLAVLASNESGQFLVAHRSMSWSPQEGTLAALARPAEEPADEGAVIERPFDAYLSADPSTQLYTAQLWVTNPFTATIHAQLSQPLPPEAMIVAGDGRLEGGAVVWERPVEPGDVRSVQVSFRMPDAAPAELRLSPAAMSFVEPAQGLRMTLASDESAVTMPAPVHVAGYVPAASFGLTTTVPLTVTNLTAAPQSGELVVTVLAGESAALRKMQAIKLPAAGEATVAISLPAALRPGRYLIEVRARFGTRDSLVLRDDLRVSGTKVFLPGLWR